jgi:preprotein translocase subunit Sss1
MIGGPVAIPGAPSSASYVWVVVLVAVGLMLLGGAGFAIMLLR